MRTMVMAAGLVAGMSVSGQTLPQIVAHRGGSLEQDENTLEGFKASYAKGVRGFETDVRFTKDRRIVVLHDERLERTTDGKGKVEALTAAEIAPARTKKSGQPVPFLEEFLDFLKDKPAAFIQVEIKGKGYREADLADMCGIMTKMVQERIDPAKVVFISFETNALQRIKFLNPKQQTCLVSSKADAQTLKAALESKVEFVSIQLDSATRAFVKDAHKAGLKVTLWTMKNADDAQLAIALGADLVATDIPAAQLALKNARP